MIGLRIREKRLAQNRSLADVAGEAKVSVATLSRVENDKQSLDLTLFLALASVLNVSPTDLLDPHDGEGEGVDPIARRIASLGAKERLELWREVAVERRQHRNRDRGTETRHLTQQIDALLAQIDLMRDELEAIRKRVRRR